MSRPMSVVAMTPASVGAGGAGQGPKSVGRRAFGGGGRRWTGGGDLAPVAVLVACTTLALELAVQVPFLGFSVLQLVFVLVAVALGEMAQETRRAFA
jgi:hypothetical protein